MATANFDLKENVQRFRFTRHGRTGSSRQTLSEDGALGVSSWMGFVTITIPITKYIVFQFDLRPDYALWLAEKLFDYAAKVENEK